MLKTYIQSSLLIVFTFLISSSAFIYTVQEDKTNADVLYVVQLSSSQSKIWSDEEFRREMNRFKSLSKYGFVYENSYLNSQKIQNSRMLLGTYQTHKTAKQIQDKVNQELNLGAYVVAIPKRPQLDKSLLMESKVQKGNLNSIANYRNIEQKSGAGTVLITATDKANEYLFTFKTFDKQLLNKIETNTSTTPVPTLTPPTLTKPNETIKPTTPTVTSGNLVNKKNVYTVKSGDTLSKIAKINGLTLAELMKMNTGISIDDVIRPGQKITIKK